MNFDFQEASAAAAENKRLTLAVTNATTKQYYGRQNRLGELPDADGMRELAGQIKQHTLDHLDWYLEKFKSEVENNGGQVHLASNGEEAKRIIAEIAEEPMQALRQK